MPKIKQGHNTHSASDAQFNTQYSCCIKYTIPFCIKYTLQYTILILHQMNNHPPTHPPSGLLWKIGDFNFMPIPTSQPQEEGGEWSDERD